MQTKITDEDLEGLEKVLEEQKPDQSEIGGWINLGGWMMWCRRPG